MDSSSEYLDSYQCVRQVKNLLESRVQIASSGSINESMNAMPMPLALGGIAGLDLDKEVLLKCSNIIPYWSAYHFIRLINSRSKIEGE